MPLDLEKAPPGIKGYADLVRNLTNEQLFERLVGWPEREVSEFTHAQFIDSLKWSLRVEIEEFRQRLSTWLALERAVLPPFSTLDTKCPRCHGMGKKIKTAHHAEPEPDGICWGRLEDRCEHMHRMCNECGYEWLEACAA